MNRIVTLIKGQPMTTSAIVSDKFDIAHRNILAKIENFTAEISAVRFNEMFKEIPREVRGREFKMYNMTRDGYMFLVMNISTKRAHDQKLAFIDAFNEMEKLLIARIKNGEDTQWLEERNQARLTRGGETDTIKEFVEYAVKQGAQSAKMYYKHYTNATYKALGMIQHGKPAVRDTLNLMQLNQLVIAEVLAKNAIEKYMKAGEHYRTIYTLVKQDLEDFAKATLLTKRTT